MVLIRHDITGLEPWCGGYKLFGSINNTSAPNPTNDFKNKIKADFRKKPKTTRNTQQLNAQGVKSYLNRLKIELN